MAEHLLSALLCKRNSLAQLDFDLAQLLCKVANVRNKREQFVLALSALVS
jgi:hypothetical protein